MKLVISLKKKLPGFILDVEWEAASEITILFGFSGAGKSMTLDMIGGFNRPDEGRIVCGNTVYFDSSKGIYTPPQKRPFGYVFQSDSLFPHMTVEENIIYGLSGIQKKEKVKRAREIIKQMNLLTFASRHPTALSGGQKQRVAMARALVRKPDILLLDEPFSSLDNPVRTEMQDLVKKIKQEFSIPIVMITHDIMEVYRLADKIIIYSDGTVPQSGSPKEIFLNPKNSNVEQLVDSFKLYKTLITDQIKK